MKTKAERKEKVRLTDRFIRDTLKAKAKPYNVMDKDVSAFGIRVQPTGTKSFILFRRFPGQDFPSRRLLGHYDNGIGRPKEELDENGNKKAREIVPGTPMSLAEARELARDWLALIKKGIDPSRAAEQERKANVEAEARRIKNTIEATLESYLLTKATLRSIAKLTTDLKRTLKPWFNRSIEDIDEGDIEDLINRLKSEGKPSQARYVYTLVRGFFAWAVRKRKLKASPCALIDTKELVGQSNERTRHLADHEIRAYWRAAEKLSYPNGPYFKLLLLTGLRRAEVSDVTSDEIDLASRRWIIPAARMKGNRAHLVPITPMIEALLSGLPRLAGGPFLFSATGARPMSAFGRAKAELDALMREELNADSHKFEKWVIHDLRRTVRTRLISLEVPEHLNERILAHAQPEINRRYNVYNFEREKRDALEIWHRALMNIVEGGNVVQLRARA